MRTLPAPRVLAAWAVTRLVLVLAVAIPLGGQQDPRGDVRLYAGWAHGLLAGHGLPTGDDRWQYPPGAAVVLALPALPHLSYLAVFVTLLLLVDLAVLVALARRRPAGVWLWLAGPCALGPVTLARFDLVPTGLAMAGLLSGTSAEPNPGPRRARAGVLYAAGGLVKVWPLLLLVAAPARRAVAGAVAALAVGFGVVAAFGWAGDAGGFLGAQRGRGLQLESVPALPFVLGHLLGVGPGARYAYGSYQFDTAAARAVAGACTLVEVAIVALLAGWWWWRDGRAGAADPADRALVLLLLVLVTSRVLSPQYLLWLIGVAACRPAGRNRGAVLLVVAAACSQVVYPLRYADLVAGRPFATVVLVLRDLVLLAATVTACLPPPASGAARRRPGPARSPLPWPARRSRPDPAGARSAAGSAAS